MKAASHFLALYSRIIILFMICVALAIASANFLSINNLVNVVRQSSMMLIMSLGMTCAMLLGRGVDMSIGSTLALSSCIAASFLTVKADAGSIVFGVIIALVIGVLVGVINGSLIAYLKLPAILVTFGMREMVRGLVYTIMRGNVVTNLHKGILFLGGGSLFNVIPMPIVIAGVLTLMTMFILRWTTVGRELYIVGANASAARFSGIKANRTIIFGFATSGLLAALAGIVYLGRLGTAEGDIGQVFAFQSVSAVAIGGISFNGGMGNVGGAIIGVLILNLLVNGLNLLNISPFWQGTVNGIIIIIAILLDHLARKRVGE